MTENKQDKLDKQIPVRIMITAFIVMLMLSALIIRLWKVQILSGFEFDERASGLYARSIRLPALRGRIFSSDGQLLAANRPSAEALFHLSEMLIQGRLGKSADHILEEVRRAEKTVGRQSGVTRKTILHHMQRKPGIPMAVFKDLTPAELAKLAELMPPIRGMELSAASTRWYPCNSLASQLIGYTRPMDPSTAEDRGDYFYYLTETAGRTGLEQLFNSRLQGKPGKKLVKVNHRGFVHEVIGEPKSTESASDLVLTLDSRLQARAEQLLAGREGAIVMMDASDGSLLAVCSAPGYNLNWFIPRISARDYKALDEQPGKPFLNKALQGAYMPGSIVKPLMALAILENGGSPDEELFCDGATYFNDHSRIRCASWLSGGHGWLDLIHAIKVSCNDYFIENGMKLGLERIQTIYRSAGIGSRTGIGLPESAGILPDRSRWKTWSLFDTALVSIGQGKIQISPLQAVSYTAAIANGGKLWKPLIVREIRNPETGVKEMARPVLRGTLAASEKNIALVREGMYCAVNETGGGASRARLTELTVSGKTGTAEVGTRENHSKNTWFIGFAELPSGRLAAVAVLVLNGDFGNTTAAPLAADMFRCAAKLNL